MEKSMNKGTLERRKQEDTYENSYCIESPNSFYVLQKERKATVKKCNFEISEFMCEAND